MEHIVRKIYYDYEKEEIWLNEMSAKGMALTGYSWCRYVFTETANNEYTYRLELLENSPKHADSIAYIKFLEETGVEYVAKYMRWVYLRKKSSEGAFNIYSDIESKIIHYKRINIIWNSVMWLEFVIALMNIAIGILDLSNLNIFISIAPILLGIGLLRAGSQNRKKIKKLKQEMSISE
jgi:hypothetical protein